MTVRFEDLSVGDEIPSGSRLVSREDVKAYADASGDQNPLHQDDEVARASGFPGIVAHGMYTMGTFASAIVGWAGDAEALVRLKVQFRAPVFMGETIVCGGTVRSGDPEQRLGGPGGWGAGGPQGAAQRGRLKGGGAGYA